MNLSRRLRNELIYLGAFVRMAVRIARVKPDSQRTIAVIVGEFARRKPDNIAIIHDARTITYRELDRAASLYANWALAQGLAKGDVVALLMENRPEYLMVWLGLARVGVVAALINTQLRGHALAHCLEVANARHAIVGTELTDAYRAAAADLARAPRLWVAGGGAGESEDLDAALALMPAAVPGDATASVRCGDIALYIYTSGTTGLPKAANVSHLRILNMMHSFSVGANATERDRMYNVLPLYHTAGGICALGPALLNGGAVILKRRFSVTEFWEDCARHRATLFQYIGEICRYLLDAPAHSMERAHTLRAALGNGLRPDIWSRFQDRFAIARIVEFYGATEGNVGLMNFDGTLGAVGRIPPYVQALFPIRIVRFDIESESPVRGAGGFCIECQPGEVGEIIGRIDPSVPRTRFEGYTKGAETEKKILHDVFEKGDAWYRTGDLMRRDKLGYFYFVDRIGDTFRWKGENVATGEVAEALSAFPAIREANVYGVRVPGREGRAGMAAIVAASGLDLAGLARHVRVALPEYARPLFLRIQNEIAVTGTFKHRKVDLVKDGIDPSRVGDPLYFLDGSAGTYVPLSPDLHARIVRGEVRL